MICEGSQEVGTICTTRIVQKVMCMCNNKDRPTIYIIKGVMFVCMFCTAGQTAGPIETKLDTRTHVHPGSVSVKVNVKVIHVCVRE